MFCTVHPSFVHILVYMKSGTPYLRKKSLFTLLSVQQPFMACSELKLGFMELCMHAWFGSLCIYILWWSFLPFSPVKTQFWIKAFLLKEGKQVHYRLKISKWKQKLFIIFGHLTCCLEILQEICPYSSKRS